MAIKKMPLNDKLEVFPVPGDIDIARDVKIELEDGVRLSANVFRPQGGTPAPVALAFTRYDKDDPPAHYLHANSEQRRAIGTGLGDIRVSEAALWEGPDPAFWVPNGYVVVTVDARGTGLSEGSNEAFGEQTASDLAQVIEWAARQSWSNGKVGLNGVSGLAIVQYQVASRSPRPQGLAAIIPWEGLSDFYRDISFHGGVPETGFSDWYRSEDYASSPGSDEPPETVEEGSPTFESMRKYFEPIDPSRIVVPLLECATWSDQGLHTRGGFNIFEGASSEEKYLYTHGRGKWTVYNSAEGLAYQRAFFDRYLKGEPDAMKGKSRVRLEIRRTIDEYEERGEDVWPPAGVRWTSLYLGADGSLSSRPPARAESVSYPATEKKPAEFSVRFDKDTEISGPAALKLWVSTDAGNDMDLFIGLRKFNAEGVEVHFEARENDRTGIVALGWLRVTQRKLDPLRSRPGRPFLIHDGELPVVAGEIYEVDIEILPSSTLFEAGSRLVLNVGGQEIWSNRMCQHRRLRNHGNHTIHAGLQRPSRLLLPIIERA